MLSNIITLSNAGDGLEQALQETERAAEAAALSRSEMLELRLIAEEMMALLRSVTGELRAKFWLEWADRRFTLHLCAKQRLSNTQRGNLVKASSSGKNAAVKGFLDKLRDVFEQALAVDRDVSNYYTASGYDTTADISDDIISARHWDKYEKTLLLTLANEVKIAIEGGQVDMTIDKKF